MHRPFRRSCRAAAEHDPQRPVEGDGYGCERSRRRRFRPAAPDGRQRVEQSLVHGAAVDAVASMSVAVAREQHGRCDEAQSVDGRLSAEVERACGERRADRCGRDGGGCRSPSVREDGGHDVTGADAHLPPAGSERGCLRAEPAERQVLRVVQRAALEPESGHGAVPRLVRRAVPADGEIARHLPPECLRIAHGPCVRLTVRRESERPVEPLSRGQRSASPAADGRP